MNKYTDIQIYILFSFISIIIIHFIVSEIHRFSFFFNLTSISNVVPRGLL